jgi:hypothetical protein
MAQITDALKQAIKTATGETDEAILSAYIGFAESDMRQHLYPFSKETEEIPDRYADKIAEIAIYKLNKRGAEGEMSHTEGGVSRDYDNPDVPASMFKGIHPFVGVPVK